MRASISSSGVDRPRRSGLRRRLAAAVVAAVLVLSWSAGVPAHARGGSAGPGSATAASTASLADPGAAAVRVGSAFDVFWMKAPGPVLESRWLPSGYGGWYTQSLGGVLASAPAQTQLGGRIDVFAVSPHGYLYQKTFTNYAWSGWHAVASGFVGGVSAVRTATQFHVFGHDSAGHLLQAYWAGAGWHVQDLGGVTTGTPAVTLRDGRYDVFAVSPHGYLYQKTFTNGWGPWHVVASDASPTPQRVLDSMTLQQRVGELLMMGNPAGSVSSVTEHDISTYHIGSIVLTGRSTAGIGHTRGVIDRLQADAVRQATGGAKLVVAADQEGGYVQVLQGPGFSRIPTALYQGTHWSPATINSQAQSYGSQLESAGVNLDLAPVLDTVSQSFAPENAPIGYYDREFGYTPQSVQVHGVAFADGLQRSGEGATVKHFPGLGRVRGNTDTTSGVTDTVTTEHSASIEPFAAGASGGADAVMVSTAYYAEIDPANPAAFSSTIITGMLRENLGFRGVVISDDLGAAQQVQAFPPGDRAVRFIQAGGDLVLTVDPSTVPAMYDAILARAQSDSSFRNQVDTAALRVLRMKADLGLIPS